MLERWAVHAVLAVDGWKPGGKLIHLFDFVLDDPLLETRNCQRILGEVLVDCQLDLVEEP